MSAPATLSPIDRFALIIDGLCASVAKQIAARTMTAALIVLVWGRLRRINTRFQRLAAKIRAGAVFDRPARPRRPGGGARSVPVRPAPPLQPPRGFAWLLPLVPSDAACFADGLRRVFAEPEMAALIAATPRMGRILRPLCHMLGIEPDFLPAPPPRRRVSPPPRDEAPPDASGAPVPRERPTSARGRAKSVGGGLATRSDIRPWYDSLVPA